MMSGNGANSIFFNKKNKDWTSRALAYTHLPPPYPYSSISDKISIFHYPPLILKVGVICVSPIT